MRASVRSGAAHGRACRAAAGLLPAASASAEPTAVFEVLTTAVGLSVSSTQHPAASIVTGGLIDSSAGYSSSAVSSAGASATASAAVYPGDLVATGPALLCSQFLPCPIEPPTYPLLAQASWPERPAASADSPTPVGTARASAAANRTEGVTSVVGATAPGAPIVVSVGSQTTRTRAWADDAGAHVRASSTLQDVVVGPLHIGVVAASDDVDVAADGRVTDRPRIELTGVTFAGLAASIDADGVHVLSASANRSRPERCPSRASTYTIGTTKTDATGAGARSTAGGLQVTFSVPVQGVPPVVPGLPGANRTYLGQLTVGGVRCRRCSGRAGWAAAGGPAGTGTRIACRPARAAAATGRLPRHAARGRRRGARQHDTSGGGDVAATQHVPRTRPAATGDAARRRTDVAAGRLASRRSVSCVGPRGEAVGRAPAARLGAGCSRRDRALPWLVRRVWHRAHREAGALRGVGRLDRRVPARPCGGVLRDRRRPSESGQACRDGTQGRSAVRLADRSRRAGARRQ